MRESKVRPSTLAIIPARGGSKGVPRKNVRLLCGKPLIAYSIEAALSSKLVDKVVVSTEDEEIAEVARIYGADVIPRPAELAQADVTLDPVIIHALKSTEERENRKYEFIATIQPTSPLLSKDTIDKALNIISAGEYDTLISVAREAHLYWMVDRETPNPLYTDRKNRQQLEPIFRETGALLLCKREVIKNKGSRIGAKIHLFEIPKEEAIDIDDYTDWQVAESLLKKLTIVFRVDGDEQIGLGHIYRGITLANRIFGHNIFFLTNRLRELGVRKLAEHNYRVLTFKEDGDLFEILDKLRPDIVINDILDTSSDYVCRLQDKGFFVVNFEDLGEGSEFANTVINALYENSNPPKNHYYGYKYECLRDEFYLFPPTKVKDGVERLLVTFGGVDENNLTLRTLRAIESAGLRDIHVLIILGIGYSPKEKLYAYTNSLKRKEFNVELRENVSMMARYVATSDLVITSNGRTVYEVASLGVPCISISQNEREMRHLFSQICKGVMNMGIAFNVSEDAIASALAKVMKDYHLRRQMSESTLKFDLKKGINRTLRLIFDGYWEWKEK